MGQFESSLTIQQLNQSQLGQEAAVTATTTATQKVQKTNGELNDNNARASATQRAQSGISTHHRSATKAQNGQAILDKQIPRSSLHVEQPIYEVCLHFIYFLKSALMD